MLPEVAELNDCLSTLRVQPTPAPDTHDSEPILGHFIANIGGQFGHVPQLYLIHPKSCTVPLGSIVKRIQRVLEKRLMSDRSGPSRGFVLLRVASGEAFGA